MEYSDSPFGLSLEEHQRIGNRAQERLDKLAKSNGIDNYEAPNIGQQAVLYVLEEAKALIESKGNDYVFGDYDPEELVHGKQGNNHNPLEDDLDHIIPSAWETGFEDEELGELTNELDSKLDVSEEELRMRLSAMIDEMECLLDLAKEGFDS